MPRHVPSAFQTALTRHMQSWRANEVDGSRSPMWDHWLDGMCESVREVARSTVERSGLKLHDYVRALPSSQAFALNLFLPFAEPGPREHLSALFSRVLGVDLAIDRIDLEWVPPGAVLAEIRGDTPGAGEPATGVDVVLWGRSNGDPVAVLVEVKLSESGFTACGGAKSSGNQRPDVCASAEMFLADPRACYLQRPRRAVRDRRYWEIFELAYGSVRAAFPGIDSKGRCPFEGDAQQPMRNLAVATGLVQAHIVRRAWFALCHHDGNPDVPVHWRKWADLLAPETKSPAVLASAILKVGLDAGLRDWAATMSRRYDLRIPGVRYDRAPSASFVQTLSPDGALAYLIQPRSVAGLALDVQFREKDHLHLYCGLTRVLDLAYRQEGVTLTAHTTYRAQAPSLFRTWRPEEYARLRDALETYLQNVEVDNRHTSKEGAVQAAWSRAAVAPWTPFDREAVIGYESTEQQTTFRSFPQVNKAYDKATSDGVTLPSGGGPAAELDQLAVAPDGTLVLIELKHSTGSANALAGAPLQLLQYLWEWHGALPTLRDRLQSILDARHTVGMSSSTVRLTGRLRGVIGLEAEIRSEEVRRRMAIVLTIANAHLPPGVPAIEVVYMPVEGTSSV